MLKRRIFMARVEGQVYSENAILWLTIFFSIKGILFWVPFCFKHFLPERSTACVKVLSSQQTEHHFVSVLMHCTHQCSDTRCELSILLLSSYPNVVCCSPQVWKYDEGLVTHIGTGHGGGIAGVKICPNQKWIITIGTDGSILRWKYPH